MRIELSDEQLKFKNEAKLFVDKEIVPLASQIDMEEKIPTDLINKISREGYLASMIPSSFGGKGQDMVNLGILNEEIGRGCSSVRSLLTVQGMVALAILRWGTDGQKAYWLPKLASGEKIGAFALTEPDTGSDAKSISTQAELSGDYYVINGKKKWITMGQIADVFLVFCQCEGKVTAFLIEKDSPGFSVSPICGLLGARASMIAELKMNDCKISKENMVGTIGTGLSHVALGSLDYGRYSIACGCVGLGQACLEASVKYTRSRKQFGTVLRQHQLIQKIITEMVVNLKAARLLCYKAGYLKDVGDPDSIMETWTAKYFASTMVVKLASDAVQIHGANGFSKDYPVERYYRDAKINEIIEGTTQMHEILIATNTFREY